jgi:pimeloyl-ACP methyl ester carboxylesterase
MTPTFILDGIFGRVRRFRGLRDKIRNHVGPCDFWDYENTGRTCLWELGRQLASHLKQVGPCHLVAYSMGGLVVRSALHQQPDSPVRKVVFLNSPHAGSYLAWMLPLSAARQMRPGSSFLKELDAGPWDHESLAVWCPGDLMVLPGTSARWPRAGQLRCSRVPAHLWPVYGPDIHRDVVGFLSD